MCHNTIVKPLNVGNVPIACAVNVTALAMSLKVLCILEGLRKPSPVASHSKKTR